MHLLSRLADWDVGVDGGWLKVRTSATVVAIETSWWLNPKRGCRMPNPGR
jgi:hypothetical protein